MLVQKLDPDIINKNMFQTKMNFTLSHLDRPKRERAVCVVRIIHCVTVILF